jgi:hypothetical protein
MNEHEILVERYEQRKTKYSEKDLCDTWTTKNTTWIGLGLSPDLHCYKAGD